MGCNAFVGSAVDGSFSGIDHFRIILRNILDHIGMHNYPVVQGLFVFSKTRNNPCFVKSIHFRMLQVIFHEEFFHPDPSGSMMLHVICEGIQEFL